MARKESALEPNGPSIQQDAEEEDDEESVVIWLALTHSSLQLASTTGGNSVPFTSTGIPE